MAYSLDSPVYCILIGLNSFIAVYYLLYDSDKPYTIAKLINFFILIFFILANAIQHANNSVVLTFNFSFAESDYILFQIVVFLILISYNVLHDIFLLQTPKSEGKKAIRFSSNKMVLISVIGTILILYHYNFNVFTLFFRGITSAMMEEYGITGPKQSSSIMAALIFGKVIRSIPWAVYLLSCFLKISKKKRVLFFVLTLITVFPTGLDRNAAAMYWIPIFIMLFKKYIKGNRFVYIMLIGVFVAFPFLNNFRRFTGEIQFEFSLDYLDSMNMDASQIFMATMLTNTITWGNQLLGSILFFMPRAIWPSKPIGSGAFLVNQMDGWFTNVSMPFFSEGFINFGIIGILLFTIFLAWLTGKLDSRYWYQGEKTSSPHEGFYLIILGAIIYIMRGDLMSSLAYTIGVSFSYYLVLVFSKKLNIKPLVNQ